LLLCLKNSSFTRLITAASQFTATELIISQIKAVGIAYFAPVVRGYRLMPLSGELDQI